MDYSLTTTVPFLAFQDRLGLRQYEAAGALYGLFMHVSFSRDVVGGDVGRMSNLMIARAVGWPEDRADELVEALVESGWIAEHPEHRLIMVDWPNRCSPWVKGKLAKAKNLDFLACYGSNNLRSGPEVTQDHDHDHDHEEAKEKGEDHDHGRNGTSRSRSQDGDGMDGASPADSDAPSVVGRIPADSFPPGMTEIEDEADPGPDPQPVPRERLEQWRKRLHDRGVTGPNLDRLAAAAAAHPDQRALGEVFITAIDDRSATNRPGLIVHRLQEFFAQPAPPDETERNRETLLGAGITDPAALDLLAQKCHETDVLEAVRCAKFQPKHERPERVERKLRGWYRLAEEVSA